MFVRGISSSLAALIAVGLLAGPAMADHRRPPPPPPYPGDDYYSGPPILRALPGLRIFFGDYALTEDEYNALYGDNPRRRRQMDQSYYEPAPAPPVKHKVKPSAKTAPTSGKPAPANQSAAAASSRKAPAGGGALSCEKATSVVSGYGFSSVRPSSCSGKVYAFNATRDGKNFAIKLDSGSGELTEVKKLP